MNMFEGSVVNDKPEEATESCKELELHRVHVPHSGRMATQTEELPWPATE